MSGFLINQEPNRVEVLDEGVSLTPNVQSLDFVGSGVEATNVDNDVTANIGGDFASTAATYLTGDDETASLANSIQVGNIDGLIKCDGSNSFSAATAGTDYQSPLTANQNIIYVGKHGNDGNDGTTLNKAFLTFSAAISAASSGDVVACLDSGEYEEDITGVSGIDVYAPNATLLLNDGDQLTLDNAKYTFKSISRTSGSGYMVVASNTTGYAHLFTADFTDEGSGDSIQASNSTLFNFMFYEAHVGNSGVFYTGDSADNHTHITGKDIYLSSANATVIQINNGGTLLMNVQHIKEINGGVGTGLAFDVNDGTINASTQEIIVTNLADIESDGNLNLDAQEASGSVTNDGVYNYIYNEKGGSFQIGSSLIADIDAQAYRLGEFLPT